MDIWRDAWIVQSTLGLLIFATMSKEQLITVEEFRQTFLSRRGFPVTHSYIYRLIREYQGKVEGKKRESLPFKYKEVGKGIMIVKD